MSSKRRRDSEEDEPARVRIKTEQELCDYNDEDYEYNGPPTPPAPCSNYDEIVKQEINDEDVEMVNGDNVIPSTSSTFTVNNTLNADLTVPRAKSPSTGVKEEVSNKNDENDGKTTENEEGPSLGDFFSFASKEQLRPVKPNAMNAEITHIQTLPVAQKAHYNTHAPDEELSYVNEGGNQINAIPLHNDKPNQSDGSDMSDDEGKPQLQKDGDRMSRYFQRNTVYEKYDFNNRKVDPKCCAVYEMKDKLLHTVDKNRVVIVEGFTGCGKTTQVPQYILDKSFESKTFCNIVVTQPRKIAAISVARRVSYERNWNLGTIVGYQVGMEDKRDKNDTLLTFMTTGVLLQKLISQKSLKEYTHIIIDEVHERDLESDFLLLVIKRIMASDLTGRESHVKLILMSATIDTKTFQRYFPFKSSDGDIVGPPVIQIPFKLRHRIDEYYLDDILQKKLDQLTQISSNLDMEKASILDDVYDIAASCIMELDDIEREANIDPRMRNKPVFQKQRGAVLVFLPGMEEIKALQRCLDQKKCENGQYRDFRWVILPLHSSITAENQAKVFESHGDTYRKIILSTNIAESSITVPDIAYVIDFCLTKSLCVDQTTNFTTLRMAWASKSQCIQRRGRTGRVAAGKVYRLVPRKFYHDLEQEIVPEMRRSNLETVILMCKKFDVDSPKGLLKDALEPPNMSGIERAVSTLKELGALTITKILKDNGNNKTSYYDTCDGDLTFIGQVMSALPIPQQCTRLILLGHCFGVMREAVIIAAGLSVKSPFQTGFGKQLDTYLEKMKHAKKGFSDLFALYHVYKFWICNYCESGSNNRNAEYRWATGAKVQLSVLREIKSTVELLEERLKRLGIEDTFTLPVDRYASLNPVELTSEQGMLLKLAIAGAFYPNYFLRRRPDLKQYERDMNKSVNGKDALRTVYFKGFPPEHIGKLYAKHIADYLACGLNIPTITFDGQKVLAIFDNSMGETIGPFSSGMFRALKLRQLRKDSLEFKVLWKEEERPYLNQWEAQVRQRRGFLSPRLRALPPISVEMVVVQVQHILSPSQFWVVLQRDLEKLKKTFDLIQDDAHISLPRSKLHPNCLCLAPFENCYYRAKVIRVVEARDVHTCLVYFIDYGNSLWVNADQLRDFSPYLVNEGIPVYPAMAIECRLKEVKPNIIHGLHWSEESIVMMKKFCGKAPYIEFEIHSIYQSVMVGELIGYQDSTKTAQKCSVNDLLVTPNEEKKLYGERAIEPYLSAENHRKRRRSHLMERREVDAASLEQVGEPHDLDFIIPPLNGQSPVTLKGPWSPLEMSFQALVHCSITKDVRIDNNSVNSVLLDHEPTTSNSRMLVASHIGVAERSKAVMIRDSTIMSAIPGILQLVCLMFAPKCELRVNRNYTKYTGLLCGCGTVTKGPNNEIIAVHPDNDMEIVFDTEIDDTDIDKVNSIRYCLNNLLKNFRSVNKSTYHKELREGVITLLRKHRTKIEEEIWPQEEYIWNRIPQDSIQPITAAGMAFTHDDIFQPHYKIRLNRQIEEDVFWDGGY